MNISRFWKRLVSTGETRKRVARVVRAADIETLEMKQVLSASALFLPATGELNIILNTNDSVRVSASNGTVLVERLSGTTFVPLTSIGNVPAANVQSIVVLGGDDGNTIDLSRVTAAQFTSLTSIEIDGANGNDLLIGSPDFGDSIIGGHGADTILGNGGNDTLLGGDGDDSVSGGTGDDSINAGDGDDVVNADDGNDSVNAGNGQDTINGGDGNDTIGGANGQDSLNGDAGDDFLNGDGGTDTINGGDGNDSILGGEFNDSLLGGNGNDTINGQAGNDTVSGEAGDDSLEGGVGNDSLVGNDGNDFINAGAGNDIALGNNGNDTILGGAGNDSLLGDGADAAVSEIGNDSINGQSGNDTIVGGGGADTLNGGAGADLVQSGFETVVPSTPLPPTQPAFPPPNPGSPLAQFDAAVASGATNVLGNTTTLTIGSGDNSVSVQVGADGAANSATFDPLGVQTAFDPYFIGDRLEFAINNGVLQSLFNFNAQMVGSTTDATSVFSQSNLNFQLIQQIEPLLDINLSTIGGLLTQTYAITNATGAPITLDLVRSTHYHNPGFADGGGRIVLAGGTELLLQPDVLGGPNTPSTYIGITSFSGQPVPTNRFEVDANPSPSPIFTDAVFNDLNGDGFMDSAEHTGLGLRSVYSIPAGGTILYTQHTVYGVSAPIDIADAPPLPPNVAPVANSDVVLGSTGQPVTFDVVSNDSDSDGVLDYSTVQIATQPANGTAVSLGNGLITYTPNPGFVGTDSFTYTVADNNGTVSAPATVAINVLVVDNIGDLMLGDSGADTIIGGAGNDTINGQADNDSLLGGGGNDLISGGAGNDTLDGQAGNDTLDGQGGNDVLIGGEGDDTFVLGNGAGGQDTVDGGDGFNGILVNGTNNADTISVDAPNGLIRVVRGAATITASVNVQAVAVNGLGGDDTITIGNLSGVVPTVLVINGGEGNDLLTANGSETGRVRLFLNGENGNDTIVGSRGNDTISGGNGNDAVNGGDGNDSILGQAGNDILAGGNGNDTISGGDGTDFLTGNAGDDSLDGGTGNDTLRGFEGNDTLQGQAGDDLLNGMDGNDSILGGVGKDQITGGSGDDTLDGGRNDDSINGNSGNDKIRGDHGNDYINAGTESDTVNGGDGHDTIIATDGNDILNGGDGNDNINAGAGNDILVGGDGNDTLLGGGGNDVLLGGDGEDVINGQGGTDTIAGNQGIDTIADPVNEIDENFVLSAAIISLLDAA